MISLSSALAQDQTQANYGSVTGAFGSQEGSASIDFNHLWLLGKSRKIEVGVGGRFTSFFGSSKYFTSAPASLAGNDSSVDSLLLQNPQLNALNVSLHLGYRLLPKLHVGFNIDAFGFTFGAQQSGTYFSGNAGQAVNAKPTSFNALLIGNNDRGTLNSEFFARYFFNEKWGVKVAFQYLFTEYTTDSQVQQAPETNDRFRYKARMVSIGVTRVF
jgi:long-subunit fatty acid transport protein